MAEHEQTNDHTDERNTAALNVDQGVNLNLSHNTATATVYDDGTIEWRWQPTPTADQSADHNETKHSSSQANKASDTAKSTARAEQPSPSAADETAEQQDEQARVKQRNVDHDDEQRDVEPTFVDCAI